MPVSYTWKIYSPATGTSPNPLSFSGSVVGVRFVIDSELSNTDVIMVTMEGTQYDIIYSGTVGNRQVKHRIATGILEFQNPIASGTKVYVLYKQ